MSRCREVGLVMVVAGSAAMASGCVVRAYSTPATATVYTSGTVHTSGEVAMDTSATYTVQNYPPEPLFEEVTVSPGYGYVWVDGYWHWNGYDWTWAGGRWVHERPGYIYVAPYYDYYGGRYVYRSGYWSHRDRLPRHVRVHSYRDGRPSVYVRSMRDNRARRYHSPYSRRYDRSVRPVRDHRRYDNRRDRRYDRGVRDHRAPDRRARDRRSPPRDHRDRGRDDRRPSRR